MVKLFFLFALSILFGCQPTSLEDFQVEGSSLARGLLKDLRKIESREDLSRIEPFLKKDFEKIVDLMILARNFQQKNPELESSFQNINATLNLSLQEELKRVYEIEGGRECVERAQREAMLKLDGKEKIIEKKERGGRSKNDLFFNLKADPMIFAIAGSPASGKSSFVQEKRKEIFSEHAFIHDCDAVMVSMEEYQNDLKALGSMRAFQNWELPAREKAESLLMDAVHEKKNIIYDRSCALPSSYNFLKDLVENHGYTLIMYVLYVDKEVAFVRAEEREEKTGRHIPRNLILERMEGIQQLWPSYLALARVCYLLDSNSKPLNIIAESRDSELTIFKEEMYAAFTSQ